MTIISAQRGVQSVEIGSKLLRILVACEGVAPLHKLATEAGISSAQTHAYLASFKSIDLVEQDEPTGHYRLGPLAVRLAMARTRSDAALDFARSKAEALSNTFGTLSTVVIREADRPTVLHISPGTEQLNLNMHVGTVLSLDHTIAGLVFKAFTTSQYDIDQVHSSHGEHKGLEINIPKIRSDGYAFGMDVAVPGVGALAAPVFDASNQIMMVLSLIGTREKLGNKAKAAMVRTLCNSTSEIRQALQDDAARRTRAADRPRRGRKAAGVRSDA